MKKQLSALLCALFLLFSVLQASAEAPVSLDALLRDIEALAETDKGLEVGPLIFEISEDRQSIFIDRPETEGSGEYTIAYNIYDSDSNPVNYFYSLEERVAATPGYGGLFNVFVVVTDNVTGESVTQNIGWQTLSWPLADALTVGPLSYEISEDQSSVYLDRPQIRCASGQVTIAYVIYDDKDEAVNYFYSTQKRVAATPGRDGKFNVFVTVTDTDTGESVTQNIGWFTVGEPEETDPYAESVVRAKMLAMKAEYPEGMPWTNSDSYSIRIGYTTYNGYGCVAFAYILSDAAFYGLPLRNFYTFTYEDVRVGDMLRINNNSHHVIVLEKHEDHIVIAEGNFNRSIHWGRTLTKAQVEAADYLTTRYPK